MRPTLRRALRRPAAELWLFGQAFVLLGLARLALALLPFRWIAPALGRVRAETPPGGLRPGQRAAVRRVAWAIRRASRATPWDSYCLVQALVATHLLRRRDIASTVYLGVAPPAARATQDVAHAWVRSGRLFVVGDDGSRLFSVIATFSNDHRRDGEGDV